MISSSLSHLIFSPVCLTIMTLDSMFNLPRPCPFSPSFPFPSPLFWGRSRDILATTFSLIFKISQLHSLLFSAKVKNLNQSKIMTFPKIQEESSTVYNLYRWSLPPSVHGLFLWWTEGGRLSESAGWGLHWSPPTNCISAKISQLGPIRSGIVTRGTEAPEDLNLHQTSNILNSDAKQLSNCSSIPAVPLYSGLQTT